MAVFPIQLTRKPHQTGEPWHLSCHGGKTPANLLSLVCPAPYGRGVGCRGSAPAQVGGEDGELAVTGFGGKTG